MDGLSCVKGIEKVFNKGVDIALCGGVGYLYGFLFRVNPVLSASCFVIAKLAFMVFRDLPVAMAGKMKWSAGSRLTLSAITKALVSAASIVVMKQYGVIGICGTVFLSVISIRSFSSGLKAAKNAYIKASA